MEPENEVPADLRKLAALRVRVERERRDARKRQREDDRALIEAADQRAERYRRANRHLTAALVAQQARIKLLRGEISRYNAELLVAQTETKRARLDAEIAEDKCRALLTAQEIDRDINEGA